MSQTTFFLTLTGASCVRCLKPVTGEADFFRFSRPSHTFLHPSRFTISLVNGVRGMCFTHREAPPLPSFVPKGDVQKFPAAPADAKHTRPDGCGRHRPPPFSPIRIACPTLSISERAGYLHLVISPTSDGLHSRVAPPFFSSSNSLSIISKTEFFDLYSGTARFIKRTISGIRTAIPNISSS